MFNLTIASVSEKIFEGEVVSFTAHGAEGEMTVLSRHMPFVTLLKEGDIVVREGGESKEKNFKIEKGLLEVGNNKAVILV
ncbi:MAG: hypothetical protein ISR99_00880 [Parcubacteria group bacterium]|nr:hypothetical protein [Parcubacteria group bacterium]